MKTERLWITLLLVGFSSLSLAACKAGQPPEEPMPIRGVTQVPEITSESEQDGFHDLVFKLGGIEQSPDGGQRFIATGIHRGNPVELEVNLGHEWKALQMEASLTMYQGKVLLRSVGSGSDSLLRAMDAIYETKLNPKQMAEATECSAISLQGDPARLRSGPVKLKLFFESEREDRYAELFLNIEAGRSRVFLSEKDPEYRKNIIVALTRKVAGKEKR